MVQKNKRVSETEHIHVSYPCKASTVLQLRLDNGQFIDFYPLNANVFILTRIIARARVIIQNKNAKLIKLSWTFFFLTCLNTVLFLRSTYKLVAGFRA